MAFVSGFVAAAGIGGWLERLRALDTTLFRLVNGAPSSVALDGIMELASSKGLLPAFCVALWSGWLVLAPGWRHRLVLAGATLALLGATDGGAGWVKKLVERPRPCWTVAETRIVMHCPASPSFPSNHAANAFALAAFVAVYDRRLATAAGLVAALIGYSRIHLGVHYPSDVVAGAAAGALLGALAGTLVRHRWRGTPPSRLTEGASEGASG